MEEHLAGTEPGSQFGRTLDELGVELIPAPAPQAKGRIEQLFNIFQDRVIKEVRLAGVSTLDAANHFWGASQLLYNQRFTVQPTQAADLHRPCPARRELDRILRIQTPRCLRKGFTLAQQGSLYQIHDNLRATHLQVEERIDEAMRITHNSRPLGCHAITVRPVRAVEVKPAHHFRRPVRPRPDHPWRKRWRPAREQRTASAIT